VGARTGPHLLTNQQTIRVPLPPDKAFAPIRRIGGRTGWYFGNVLWRNPRADRFDDGRRRHAARPARSGDSAAREHVGFSGRVELYEPGRRLRLFAEMRVPGRAWLEFTAEPDGPNHGPQADRTVRTARARWTAVLVSLVAGARVMFRGMLRCIAAAALHTSEAAK